MVDEILNILSDGHVTSAAVLASRLGAPLAEVEAKLEMLAKEGRVRKKYVAISKEDIRDGRELCGCDAHDVLLFWELA